MKLLKRLSCFAAAALVMACSVLSVFADEEKVFEYWEDENMVVEESDAPTLSFDMKDWKNYVHMTTDASLIDLTADNDNKNAYQGQSLKLSVMSKKDITDWHQFQWTVRDADNNVMYPEAQEAADEENESKKSSGKFLSCGIELHANELGMKYFDGGMLTFSYRINPDIDGLLMNNSCYVFMIDDNGLRAGKELQLKYNNTDSDNTTRWAKGVFPVAENIGATKLIIMIPLTKATDKIEALYLDNLTYTTQTDKIVANLDGYNENAVPQEVPQDLKIKQKENTISLSESSKTAKSVVKNVFVYIGIGLVGAAVIAGIVFAVLKLRNRFY